MFGQTRSSRRRRYGDSRPSSPMSRSEKKGFVIVFCALFLLFGVLLLDFIALPDQSIDSAVVNKNYLPPSRGRTSTSASWPISEKWQLSFDVCGKSAEIQVSHEFYDQVHVGDTLKIVYTRSRIFHEIEIVSVSR